MVNDKNTKNEKSIVPHEEYTQTYIEILNTYKEQISSSVENKNELKRRFFGVIKFMLMFLFVASILISFFIFVKMINQQYQSVAVITGAVTAILSSFATMVLSIFKLPKIIADYLFNKEEDKLMNEVIKNIQKYEIDAVRLEITAVNGSNMEKIIAPKNDSQMGDSPNTAGRSPKSALPEKGSLNVVGEHREISGA